MAKKRIFLVVAFLSIIIQVWIFRQRIPIVDYGTIQVSCLACTCPDSKVIQGAEYIESITPDSLKQFHLDYNEVYLTKHPHTTIDPMGCDNYFINGIVIGKDRVHEGYPWNPLIEVQSWQSTSPFDILLTWGIRINLLIQILIFFIALIKKTVPNKT